jgi:poly(A) polymerase Pap1
MYFCNILCMYGSYRLDAHLPNADIDSVVV